MPAITAALAAAGLIGSAQAAIQTAGALLVDVNATSLPSGPLASIANAGTMGGVFEAGGSGASIAEVYGPGTTKGILLDGNGFLQHKDMVGGVLKSADPGLTGVNPTASIEAWVLNPSIPGEETIVAWGHRGPNTPDGSNMSFNYGYDARWGAVGHWGSPDIGWDSCCNTTGGSPPGVPAAGEWHHLVYTFDGTTQRIYIDGVLKNSEAISLITFPLPAITIGGQLLDDASTVEPALRASMTIGRIRIHQEALTAANVANNYNFEKADFTGVASYVDVAPIHRYRFANPAGPGPDESSITDSIGTAHGTVQGNGALFTGTRVTIPGGASSDAAYIDLPNGLLSVNSSDSGGSGQITLEGWTKVTGNRQWSRILDWGSSDISTIADDQPGGLVGGELLGPGGVGANTGQGMDYLFYDAQNNVNTARRDVDIRNIDPPEGPEQAVGFDTPNFQIDFHWAITWDENGGVIRVYENGNEVGSFGVDTVQNRFSKYHDVNVWLGRSNWTGDQNMQGEYDEFRIYNKVLTGQELARSFVAGPAQMHLPGQTPAFDKQPSNVTVEEQLTATFTVETRGQGPMNFRWIRGDATNQIPGATGQSYSLVASAADNGVHFRCLAYNALGSAVSAVATLTVNADVTPPTLLGAAGGTAWGLDDHHFGVRFSEPVNTADATTLANYSVSGVALVPGPLQLLADNVTVVGFTTVGSLKAAGCKSITVTGLIRDRAPGQNPLAVPATAGIIYAEGTIRYHRFNNSGAGFPDTPDVIDHPAKTENPEGNGDHGNNYISQGLALISPPVSGPYKFYIASDDASELYLSTDDNPANKVLISREPNWAEFRVYTGVIRSDNSDTGRGNPQANISSPINLTAGCRYYFEVHHAEGGGGDYWTVAWQIPGGPVPPNGSDPIGPQYISPFETPPAIPSAQPVDQTLDEGRRATLTANITGSPVLNIQWFRGPDPIPGANSRTYITDPLVFPADNGATFHVEVMNSIGSAVSRTATLHVNDDSVPPVLVRGLAGPLLDVFSLQFNEILDAGTAGDTFNYTINGNNPVSAILSADGMVVTLKYGPQTPDTDYMVHIENVADFARNPIAPTDVVIRSVIESCGGVQFQAYNAGGGNAVSVLTSHPSFPNSPDFVAYIANLDSRLAYPTDAREAYGARMRGAFFPRESGAHFFYLAADDNAELWLSTDVQPANRVLIATETSWSNTKEWTASAGGSSVANKKSPAINLVAGQAYYIEALYKEGTGGDHCSVAVQSPSDAGPPANGSGEIQGNQLGRFAPANILGAVTLNPANPADVSVDAGALVSFSVGATPPADFAPLCYQWERDSNDGNGFQPIASANGPNYGFGPVVLSDNGATFRCLVGSIGTKVASRAALLSVSVDTNPPVCVSATPSLTLSNIVILFSEFVEMGTAQDTFNYSVSGGISVNSAVLNADGKSVTLSLAGTLSLGSSYSVTILSVTDLAGIVINPNPCTLNFRTPVISCGFLVFQAYRPESTSDNNIDSTLLADPNFPSRPNEVLYMSAFDTRTVYPNDSHEGYGALMFGYFIPPTSGNWIFYLRSDDSSRLFLNPNGSDAAGKTMIQEETGCCGAFSGHASAPQALTAGQQYYIEAILKEGTGGDYCQVA
ncbi:MAG TPA: LamG-like jellyroll fold domain-containing protein, partial [Verrucomicrobiae bacterium]|nr:LamG-like jellyroll fold domain-containing protein [Verrucomicrobiae bacterium]